ncbi:hypothetical protein HN51_002429 [Arachis hypogaea]
MVGGGSKREEAPVINSPFVFAALGSLKKKKKPEILRRNRLHPRGEPPRPLPPPLPPPHNSRRKKRFSGPRRHSRRSHGLTLTTRMMTTTTPSPLHLNPFGALLLLLQLNPRPMLSPVAWIATRLGKGGLVELFMFSHSVEPETVVKKPREPSLSTKETEEQLSKKELKKKELEAVLAELGLQKEPGSQADFHGNMIAEKKVEDRNGELEKKENATSESKNSKKKKDKSSKEQKESQNLPDSVADGKTTTETAGTGKAEDAPVTDVKERHKKVASVKKKKSRRWMLLLGVQGLPWQREKIRRLTTISSLCGKQADKSDDVDMDNGVEMNGQDVIDGSKGQCAILVLPRLTMPGHRIDPPCGSVYLQYGQQKSVADAETAKDAVAEGGSIPGSRAKLWRRIREFNACIPFSEVTLALITMLPAAPNLPPESPPLPPRHQKLLQL